MRVRGYRLFELLAWPAVVWCALEVAIRAPDATRFEGLREQIMLDATLQVEIGSTSYEGQEVIGRIRIRRSA